MKKRFIIHLVTVNNLRIYSFCIFQKATFLNFFMFEKFMKQLEILFLQKLCKSLCWMSGSLLLMKILIQFLIKKDSSFEMIRQIIIIAFQEGNNILKLIMMWTMFKNLFYKEVKYMTWCIMLLNILNLFSF